MLENKLHATLEELRGEVKSEEYIGLVVAGALINCLSQNNNYNADINIQRILQSERKAYTVLNEMFQKVEREIPSLKGVFDPLNRFNQLESSQIIRFFYNLTDILKEATVEQLILTYLKNNSFMDSHQTPECINELVAEILHPTGSLYDGTMHYGGGVMAMFSHAQSRGRSLDIIGQEISPVSWAIAKIRLYIVGVESNMVALGNVLTHPSHTTTDSVEKFDHVYMAPPIGLRLHEADKLKSDKYSRFIYGIPPKTSADYAFVSHALASLNEKGKGVILVGDGPLFRGAAEGKIRQNIIESDVIEAVISLPGGLLRTSSIPVNLIVFNKDKEVSKRNKIHFIKVTDEDVAKRRQTKKLTPETIEKVVHVLEENKEIAEFSRILSHEQLEEGILLPSRYIFPSTLDIEGMGLVRFDLRALQAMEKIKLLHNAEFYRGFNVGSKHEETSDGAYQIIRLSDVQDGKLLLDQVPHFNIENNARIDMYRVQKGDVIVSIRGSMIKTAVIEVDIDNLLLSQNFIGIRCGSLIDSHYLKAYIESPVGQYLLLNRMSGTAILTLGRKDLEALEVPSIPLEQQREITEAYVQREKDVETEIAILEKELTMKKQELYKNMGLEEIYTM